MSDVQPLLFLSDRRVDTADRAVLLEDGRRLELTGLEAAFIAYLASRPGETVDRDELLRVVWGYASGVESRAIDKSVHRLRTKLEVDPAQPRHLVGVRGLGYRLDGVRARRGRLARAEATRALQAMGERTGADLALAGYDPETLDRIAALLVGDPDALAAVAPLLGLFSASELEAHLRAAIASDAPAEERWLVELRAAVTDWWADLPGVEREILQILAGFRGSFTVAGALAVLPAPLRGAALGVLERAAQAQVVLPQPVLGGPRRMRLGSAPRVHALRQLPGVEARASVVARIAAQVLAEAEALEAQHRRGDVSAARAGLLLLEEDLWAILQQATEGEPETAARALWLLAVTAMRHQPQPILAAVDRILPLCVGPTRARLLEARGRALHVLGRVSEASATLSDALALSADPVLRAEILVDMAGVGFWTGESIEESRLHLEGALATLVDVEEPRLEARLWMELANWHMRQGEQELALSYAQRSILAFRANRDLALLVLALGQAGHALVWMCRYEEALALAEELREVGRELGDMGTELRALLTIFCCQFDLGRVQDAVVSSEAARLLAVALGRRQAQILSHQACGYAALGNRLYEQARHHFQAAQRHAAEVGNAVLEDSAVCDLGLLAHLQGDWDEARARYERCLTEAPGRDVLAFLWWVLCLRLLLALERGERDVLAQRVSELTALLPADPRPHHRHLRMVRDLVAQIADPGRSWPPGDELAGRLRAFAGALPLENGHEVRLLARLALAAAERVG